MVFGLVISLVFTRKRLIGLTVLLVLAGSAFVYGLRSLEAAMTFRPSRMSATQVIPAKAENVWLNSRDGTRLNGWFFPSQTKPEVATIVFFHGNGGNISNIGWLAERFASHGFNVLIFDYRGYGLSDGVAANESDLYADGDAAVDFVMNKKGIRSEQIVLYGHSLGTAIVSDVASRRAVGAVVLESGFSSASSVATSALPWLPRFLHVLGKNRFESARKLKNVKCPILIAHGDPDGTIPTNEAHLLYAAANEPKTLLIVPGAGHVVFGSAGKEYLDQVEQFMRESIRARQ
jgi:uncharacterized protein